jgi:tetrahydromethanopterin S-methyltransferase subunit G
MMREIVGETVKRLEQRRLERKKQRLEKIEKRLERIENKEQSINKNLSQKIKKNRLNR